MGKKFGLPTYPIVDGMLIGEREIDELEWLLEHGAIQSDLYRYAKIVKVSDTLYHLVKVEDNRYEDKQEVLLAATSLPSLLNGIAKPINIEGWRWWSKQE